MGEETEMIRKAWWRNTEIWLYNLAYAAVGGAANSTAAVFIAPETFNFKAWHKLVELFAAGAVIAVLFYLKQSPLPKKPKGLNEDSDTPVLPTP
jgi:hypothetical protein